MIKHVGKFNERDVVILFRKVPDEEHMCLVVYLDTLPAKYSGDLNKALNSTDGQDANCFADVLAQRVLNNGTPLLNSLHTEGFIKKAQTNGVLVTANEKSKVRLDELNKLIDELEAGKNAAEVMGAYEAADATPEVEQAMATLARDVTDADPAAQATSMMELADELMAKARMLKEAAEKLQPKSKPEPKPTPVAVVEPVSVDVVADTVVTENADTKLNTISDAEKPAPKRKPARRSKAAASTTNGE